MKKVTEKVPKYVTGKKDYVICLIAWLIDKIDVDIYSVSYCYKINMRVIKLIWIYLIMQQKLI